MLAVHIRRGDYESHCQALAGWGSDYMGLLQHPDVLDRFEPPPKEEEQQRKEYYMDHCWPSIERIAERIEGVRRDYEAVYFKAIDGNNIGGSVGNENEKQERYRLRRLYIMTNALPTSDFYLRLSERLLAAGEWDVVTSSNDLALTTAQSHVSQAIDAAIGERATAFIGNGVSELPPRCIGGKSPNITDITFHPKTYVVLDTVIKRCDPADGSRLTHGQQSPLVKGMKRK
jgi:hypothetical protein